MKKLLIVLPLIMFLSGCFEAVVCNPKYVHSDHLLFADLSNVPVKLQVTDSRGEKIFFKLMWAKYWDSDTDKQSKYQPVILEKTPKKIIEESLTRALKERGFVIKDDAPTVLHADLTKFLFTLDGKPIAHANIDVTISIRNSKREIVERSFSGYAEKAFDSFHQLQEAEPVLSNCLSQIVEKIANDQAILTAVKASYAAPVTTEPENRPAPKIITGTGFAVDRDGLIVTAYHVIKKAKTIKVFYTKDSFDRAQIIQKDPINDLAVLKVARQTPDFLQMAPERSAEMGDEVFTVGFPVMSILGSKAKYTEGVISSVSGLGDASSLLQITVPVQPGNSGGALINEDGEVVGVITSTAAIMPFLEKAGTLPQNISWAVKVDYLRPLIKLPEGEHNKYDRKQIIAHTKKSTFLIEAE